MRLKTRKRTLLLTLLLLTVVIGLPVWSVYRQVRQERLNRDLIAAIKKNDTATAIALLNAGVDVNAQDKGNAPVSARQVLMTWIERLRGRKSTQKTLYPSALSVASDIYVEQRDGRVTPPENTALVKALLDRGADPNVRDEDGNTPLIKATQYGHTSTARLLLDHSADIHVRNNRGVTALIYAGIRHPTGMIELLLDRGADVNDRDHYGDTALMFACEYECYRAGLERLLEAGADVNAKGEYGYTPLIYATYHGDTFALKLLLEHGADVNTKGRDGDTALKFAQRGEWADIVRLLKKAGAKE
jgi:ankyrin repeat protein